MVLLWLLQSVPESSEERLLEIGSPNSYLNIWFWKKLAFHVHTRHTHSHETHINGSQSQEYCPKDFEALPLSWLSLESGSRPNGPGCSQQLKFPSTRPKERLEVQVTGLSPPSLSQLTSWVLLVRFIAALEAPSSSFLSVPRPRGNPELAPSPALE